MPSRPHEYRFKVRRRFDLACRLVVERRVVYGLDDLSCSFVFELQEVWEVVLAELRIVVL